MARAVVEKGLVDYASVNIQSRRAVTSCIRSKESDRLRLTGSTAQPMTCRVSR